jgi:hypothetical protein
MIILHVKEDISGEIELRTGIQHIFDETLVRRIKSRTPLFYGATKSGSYLTKELLEDLICLSGDTSG